jgi:hypothetical protein
MKRMKSVRRWAVVCRRGRLVCDLGFPLIFTSKGEAGINAIDGDRMARVEIREVRS